MIQNIIQNKNGFTLVEALVALSILIVGIISGFILVTKALYDVTIIQDRLTASFLAQEGIEFVRQIRDSNYVKTINGTLTPWNEGLADDSYLVSSIGNPPTSIKLLPYDDKILKYNSNTGLYNYDTGQDTVFKRKITITNLPPNEILVQSIMDWTSKGVNFHLVVEDRLFNWLKL